MYNKSDIIQIVLNMSLFFLMIRLPPGSTPTDTLFPYTTLFRSLRGGGTACQKSRHAVSPPRIANDQLRPRNGPRSTRSTRPSRIFTSQRSEEHTSELQSLMRISYAVF